MVLAVQAGLVAAIATVTAVAARVLLPKQSKGRKRLYRDPDPLICVFQVAILLRIQDHIIFSVRKTCVIISIQALIMDNMELIHLVGARRIRPVNRNRFSCCRHIRISVAGIHQIKIVKFYIVLRCNLLKPVHRFGIQRVVFVWYDAVHQQFDILRFGHFKLTLIDVKQCVFWHMRRDVIHFFDRHLRYHLCGCRVLIGYTAHSEFSLAHFSSVRDNLLSNSEDSLYFLCLQISGINRHVILMEQILQINSKIITGHEHAIFIRKLQPDRDFLILHDSRLNTVNKPIIRRAVVFVVMRVVSFQFPCSCFSSVVIGERQKFRQVNDLLSALSCNDILFVNMFKQPRIHTFR